jgi:MFS family permease
MRRDMARVSSQAATTGKREHAFPALRHRNFRFFFIGTMLAMMADNIEHVVSYWLLYQKFHSPALAGFAEISHWTPFLLLSIYFGGIADRYDCRKIVQAAQVLFMAVSAAWAILFFTDAIQMWHAGLLLILHGLAGVMWAPAEQLLIHDIVGADDIRSAVRLNATARQLGLLFGPAVGAGLMLLLHPPLALIVNVLIYLPLTLWLLRVPYTGHLREDGAPKRTIRWKDAFQVFGEVANNRPIITMVLLGGSASLFIGNAFQSLMPAFAADLGAGDAGFTYSALLMATAAGAVFGGFLLEGKGWLQANVRSAIVCAIFWCAAMGGFALSRNYYLSLVLLFLAGILNLAFYSSAQAIVQILAPAHLRGRLVGLFTMAAQGLRAFSGVTVGIMGSFVGIHGSLASSAAALFVVTGCLLLYATPKKAL